MMNITAPTPEEDTAAALSRFVALHGAQLRAFSFPPSLYATLHAKLASETFDGGASLCIEQRPDGTRQVSASRALGTACDVFLIDHAWSFNAADARAMLASSDGLLQRVAEMAGVRLPGTCLECGADSDDDEPECEDSLRPRAWRPRLADDAVDRVLAAAWRLAGFYQLRDAASPGCEEVWYLLDELGSAFRHDDAPSFAVMPFLYHSGAAPQPFSLAWPLRDVDEGDEATRDTLVGELDGALRSSLLAALYRRPVAGAWAAWRERAAADAAAATERSDASPPAAPPPAPVVAVEPPPPLPVFTDIDWVADHLRRRDFPVVATAENARVWWLKSSVSAPPPAGVIVNQLPGEECLVFKHRLARTCGGRPWLPPTFNLRDSSDAAAFLGWHASTSPPPLVVVKPWNSGRSIGAFVAGSAQEATVRSRLVPCVAQHYLPPATHKGRKFDVRFLLAVTALHPSPRAAVWAPAIVRVANKPYSENGSARADFQTSFTSMRAGGFPEEDVSEAELVAGLAVSGVSWPAAREAARALMRDMLADAAAVCPPSPGCVALYGIDVLLDAAGSPWLLEVTFAPGVERVLSRDPAFFNKLFGHLFRGENDGFVPLFPTHPPAARADDADALPASLFADPPDFLPPAPPHGEAILARRRPPSGQPASLALRLCPPHSLHGHRLWNAAAWVSHSIDESHPLLNVSGKCVLELGAGAGAPSLVASLNGARRVVATDYGTPHDTSLVDALAHNAAWLASLRAVSPPAGGNGAWRCDVAPVAHVWGDVVGPLLALLPPGQAGFDLIIGCDLLFARARHAQLAATVAACLAPRGRAVFAFSHHDPQKRDLDLAFFEVAASAGLRSKCVTSVLADQSMFVENDGMDDARRVIYVYELWREEC